MKKLICILIGVFLLGACASSQTTSFDRVAVAMAGNNERSSGKLLMINVPDAGNPVSNGIMLTALAGGTASNAVKGIVDITLPGIEPSNGGLHPITQMCYDLNDAFNSLGFEVYNGPEITSELFAFDNLNFPPEHPARESMDTYWIKDHDRGHGAKRLCLRPHLTGASVRYLQKHGAPARFVYPGRVYRSETTDARHERAFFQYEALIIDKDFSFASGKILVKTILDKVFGRDVKVRMRAGYFPFVEPGFEIDMECLVCEGVGCKVCKHVGWIEVMPGGTPHPNVLRAAGLDPSIWSGFYINIGLDRLVMMRYGVDDVRLFHSADLRFLNQFK